MNAVQIQTLIDSLPASGGSVQLPPGTHNIEAPLRIRRSNVGLIGDPSGTILASQQSGGMPTIFVGPTLNPQPQLFDGVMGCWINLRDTYSSELDGLATLSLVFDLNLTILPPAGDDQVIISSGGARGNYGEYTQSLRLSVLNGQLRGWLTTDSGHPVLQTPIAVGQHHVSLSYDGTKVTLTLDGVSVSTTATGLVHQGFYEDFTLGSDLARWPDNVSLSRPVTGVLTNFVITGNGSSRISIPSLVASDQLVSCSTLIGPATLVLRKAGSQPGLNYCCITDLTINAAHGHGLFVTNTQNSRFERLYVQGRQGISLWNNAYRNVVRDSTINANLQKGRYALCLVDACSLCDVHNLQMQGGTGVGVVAGNSSCGFTDCFTYGGTMRMGLLAKGDGGWCHWVRGMVTDEGQSVPGQTSLMFSGLDCALVESGGSYALGYANPVIIADHVQAMSLIGHQIGLKTGVPAAFVLASVGKVVVQSCCQIPITAPWAGDMTKVTVVG